MTTHKALYLKPGREKSVLQCHPWIFSGAVARVEGDPGQGETVVIYGSTGQPLGKAAYSPLSQIRARMWTTDIGEEIGPEFLHRRVVQALELRKKTIAAEETDAHRLVHGESDGLPGIIVDRYRDTLVMQCLTASADNWREVVADILLDMTPAHGVYERSDVDVRRLEGLTERTGVVRGKEPPGLITILENGLNFYVDVRTGQKTGFYLDQRANRQRLKEFSLGRSVLNCFCYTGGFTVYGLAGGAQNVLSVDSSSDALAMGTRNLELNHLDPISGEWVEGDVFQVLRQMRDRGRKFDLIVLDPPKFAPTSAQVERAARGYKDINLLAFKLLNPGGILFTFSCSGGISGELFQKIVAGAALDAEVDAGVIGYLHPGPDHPVALNFPEGAYLKGLICHVR